MDIGELSKLSLLLIIEQHVYYCVCHCDFYSYCGREFVLVLQLLSFTTQIICLNHLGEYLVVLEDSQGHILGQNKLLVLVQSRILPHLSDQIRLLFQQLLQVNNSEIVGWPSRLAVFEPSVVIQVLSSQPANVPVQIQLLKAVPLFTNHVENLYADVLIVQVVVVPSPDQND